MVMEIQEKTTFTCLTTEQCGLTYLMAKSTWADAFIISSLTHPGIYQYLYEAALFLTSANATMSSTLKARVKWLLTMITAITTIQETM